MELRFPLHIMIFDCVKRLWTHGSTGGCHLFSSFLSSNTAHTSAPLQRILSRAMHTTRWCVKMCNR